MHTVLEKDPETDEEINSVGFCFNFLFFFFFKNNSIIN
jgi:hypothetical protein